MRVLGITGSIGMGKSVLAAQLKHLGVPTQNADHSVHRLLAKGGAAEKAVKAAFPKAVGAQGAIDRAALGKIVFADTEKREQLEAILHPLVAEAEMRFAQRMQALGVKMVAFDIPLLFETGAEARCDAVIVATAPGWLQRQRVLSRPGMSEEKFAAILRAQMSDAEKRARADFVVKTGLGKAYSLRRLKEIMVMLDA